MLISDVLTRGRHETCYTVFPDSNRRVQSLASETTQDPRANGTWLSKLTECNMKLGQTIDQKARRDGTEARENEEREKRED